MAKVTLFKSTDSGAPTLSGTSGALLSVLSHCLIIGKVFSTANDSTFNDNTNEARLNGGTSFTMFPTPATADRTYFGSSSTFSRLIFIFGTAGSAATYVWEYWNGIAWTNLVVVDGTSSFTVNGTVTWTTPTDWATNSINGTTMYWVRVRFTGTAPTTNPLVNSITYLGWLEYFTGTNQKDYRAGFGNSFYVDVNDNAPGTGGAREARIIGYEAMTALATGTGLFPTAAQQPAGLSWRKSNTLDATARPWFMVADDRTFYLFVLTSDVVQYYSFAMFGDMFSLAGAGDGFRTMIIGRTAEAAALGTTGTDYGSSLTTLATATLGHFMARTHTGAGTSITVGKHGNGAAGSLTITIGTIPYLNPLDLGTYASRVWVHETTGNLRGRMRGFWHFLHALPGVGAGDTFTYSGKTFLIVKGSAAITAAAITDVYVIEISDTWETN